MDTPFVKLAVGIKDGEILWKICKDRSVLSRLSPSQLAVSVALPGSALH